MRSPTAREFLIPIMLRNRAAGTIARDFVGFTAGNLKHAARAHAAPSGGDLPPRLAPQRGSDKAVGCGAALHGSGQ